MSEFKCEDCDKTTRTIDDLLQCPRCGSFHVLDMDDDYSNFDDTYGFLTGENDYETDY